MGRQNAPHASSSTTSQVFGQHPHAMTRSYLRYRHSRMALGHCNKLLLFFVLGRLRIGVHGLRPSCFRLRTASRPCFARELVQPCEQTDCLSKLRRSRAQSNEALRQRWRQSGATSPPRCSVEAGDSTLNPAPLSIAENGQGLRELRFETWMEIEARIARDVSQAGACAVVVPVGATEQHGPTGLIGTDHMTAEVCRDVAAAAVARGVSEATGVVLAPSINYGMSVHHSFFPGTVSLNPATFIGVLRDVASSLVKSGFTHVLFINGHGGNVIPAFKAFADEFAKREKPVDTSLCAEPSHAVNSHNGGYAHGARTSIHELQETAGAGSKNPVAHQEGNQKSRAPEASTKEMEGPGEGPRVKLINWYSGRETSALARELYGAELGQHATPDEVAVTQHLFPEFIKEGVLLDPSAIQVAKNLGGMTKRIKDDDTGLPVMDAQDFRRRFPDGRMHSNPALATPEDGRRLLDAAVRDATEGLKKFISGEDLVEEAAAAAARRERAEAGAPPRHRRQSDGRTKPYGRGHWQRKRRKEGPAQHEAAGGSGPSTAAFVAGRGRAADGPSAKEGSQGGNGGGEPRRD